MNATQTKLHDTAGKQNTSALQNPIYDPTENGYPKSHRPTLNTSPTCIT